MTEYIKILQELQLILKNSSTPLTVQQLSKEIGINRNAVAKYMDILTITGQAEMKKIGPAKLFTLAKRIPITNMMNLAKDVFMVIDEKTRVIDINNSISKVLEISKEKFIGQKVTVFREKYGVELDSEKGKEAINKALEGKETVLEFPIGYNDKKRYFEAKFIPTTLNNGANGATIILEDITEQKKIEEEREDALEKLKKTNEELEEERNLFIQGPVALFKYRNEDNWPVEYASENVKEIFGHTPEEFKEDKVQYIDLIHDDDFEMVSKEARKFDKKGVRHFTHSPYRIKRKDGSVHWVSVNTQIVRNDDNSISHYLCYIIDITKSKKRE
ncbi:MAG: PAS domain S-box protein [Nanobdellota archaeon]